MRCYSPNERPGKRRHSFIDAHVFGNDDTRYPGFQKPFAEFPMHRCYYKSASSRWAGMVDELEALPSVVLHEQSCFQTMSTNFSPRTICSSRTVRYLLQQLLASLPMRPTVEHTVAPAKEIIGTVGTLKGIVLHKYSRRTEWATLTYQAFGEPAAQDELFRKRSVETRSPRA